MRQAFGSPGGKSRVAKKLIKYIPKHKTYIEPFCGGAAIYFAKEPSEVEVLNDLDSEIAFAYKFLKDISDSEIDKLEQIDWSPRKEVFERLKNSKPPRDKIKRFFRFYYLTRYSYGKAMKNFSPDKDFKSATMNRKKFERLRERLKNTLIYCKDYKYVLSKFNSPDSFAFIDPPCPSEWPSTLAGTVFSKDQCQEMHDILKQWKGKFMLTLNSEDWIKDMFKDFNIKKFKIPRTLQGHNPSSQYELLITNYGLTKKEEKLSLFKRFYGEVFG